MIMHEVEHWIKGPYGNLRIQGVLAVTAVIMNLILRVYLNVRDIFNVLKQLAQFFDDLVKIFAERR